MKRPAWLTGPKLPPSWNRAKSVKALLVLAGVRDTPETWKRLAQLYDAAIGDERPPLEVAVEIVETLRREFP